jgi:chromosome segregation ATPase
MVDEPENLVLAHLRRLDAKVDRIADDLVALKTDVAELRTDVGSHTRVLDALRQDVRMIRAAVNDIARTDITSGEVEALRHDLNRVQRELAQLAARVDAIEDRSGPEGRRGLLRPTLNYTQLLIDPVEQ